MQRRDALYGAGLAALLSATVAVAACGRTAGPAETPRRAFTPASGKAAPAPSGTAHGVSVLLCDGKTRATFPPGTSGTTIAGTLMAEWMRQNPNSHWAAEERERHTLKPAADNKELIGSVNGHTYGRVTAQDVALWKSETERVALAGSAVFHSAAELGSTIGVSCDMCHPNAANTHPETYPKFQVQLGRVALLRDMINWCIEHPVRGKPLSSDDPKMRALEAYILAERKGTRLDYGKH